MAQEKYDFDYVHSILVECVIRDPGNLVYQEVFLSNLQRKFNNNKRGSLLNFGGRGPFKKALARQDWEQVIKLGPDILRSNPWDVPTLRAMAEACAAMGYYDSELRYLKNALDANPKSSEVNRHCALSLTRIGQFDQAIACWSRVDEIKRGDQEAQEAISQLQIARTTGVIPEETAAALAKRRAQQPLNQPVDIKSSNSEAPRREIRRTPRQELEQQIAMNPVGLESYFELADLHIQQDRLGDAAMVLAKAVAMSGGDFKARERLEDVEILRRQAQLAIAEKRSAEGTDEQTRKLAEQLRADLNRYELEVYQTRAERYPANRELKYQLGLRLKRAENPREALTCFQESLKLPERQADSYLELGECLQRLKQYEKALDCYVRAVEAAKDVEKTEQQKLARYRCGVLASGLRNFELAESHFERLLELDPTYKDAAPRLHKIRETRHKG